MLLRVLAAWPASVRLRTAAFQLAAAMCDDGNREAQKYFVDRLRSGEVVVVASQEFRAVQGMLERHYRKTKASQPSSLNDEKIRGCAWTVRFLTNLLVGQHVEMQNLMTKQTGLTKAVNLLAELENLLFALAGGRQAGADQMLIRKTQRASERFLCIEVLRFFTGAMDGAHGINQAFVSVSGVPDLLGQLLVTPFAESLDAAGEDAHVHELAATSVRTSAFKLCRRFRAQRRSLNAPGRNFGEIRRRPGPRGRRRWPASTPWSRGIPSSRRPWKISGRSSRRAFSATCSKNARPCTNRCERRDRSPRSTSSGPAATSRPRPRSIVYGESSSRRSRR